MNILEALQSRGLAPKRKGANQTKGVEYGSPCPRCGGKDRFISWPDCRDADGERRGGAWHCRVCDHGGDFIEYLMFIEGMSFADACGMAGRELPERDPYRTPVPRQGRSAEHRPAVIEPPVESWADKAAALVDWAQAQLLGNPEQLAWLAGRGITRETARRFRLGWNPGEKGKDLFRSRESWGLATVTKEDGRKKRLWIPVGLTIPSLVGSGLQRVRIRRPEGEPRYYVLPGSAMAPMLLRPASRCIVVVESELDAVLLDQEAGELCGCLALGSSSTKPDAEAHAALQKAALILVALDFDKAGRSAWLWWKDNYPQAERWPVPAGKDPGEAHQAGIDLAGWVRAGMPSVWSASAAPEPAPEPAPVAPAAETGREPKCFEVTTKSGHVIYVVERESDKPHFEAPGRALFSSREIEAMRGMDPAAVAATIAAKNVFTGARVLAHNLEESAS